MRGKVWVVAVVGALMMFGAAERADAQRLAPDARPMFGQTRLRSGFRPDPQILGGTMGGPIRASELDGRCRGYISSAPNHVLITNTGFRLIRFLVNAPTDSTLVVMLPNGSLLCDDDGGSGLNPLLSTTAPRGRIAIWVGAYSQSATGRPYNLGITEMGSVNTQNIPPPGAARPGPAVVQARPPPSAGGLNPQMPAAFGAVSLRSGFRPDPQILGGMAGGPGAAIRGNQVSGGCRGYYTPQPNHVVMSPTGFRQIRFAVNSGVDTTLLVMLPSGQVLCDDDGGSGLNPLLSTASPPGPIRVWVGIYSQGRSGPYNVGVSEMGNLTTASVPPPGSGAVVQARPPAQPATPAQVVALTVGIPTTLLGPAMTDPVVATWAPRGGPSTPVQLQGVNLMAGSTRVETLPQSLRDPTVTVTQRRNGNLVVRAEQPPMGRGDRGQTFLLHVAWQGRPVVVDRWSGAATQRGPRWSR